MKNAVQKSRFFLSALTITFIALGVLPSWGDPAPYSDANEIDLTQLLPNPPALDSPQMNSELGEVLTLQVTRTTKQTARAIADTEESVWRFADVINNTNFTRENLPKLAALFDRILATESAVVDPAKVFWKRPRPYQYSDLVHPVVPISKSASYPSGHATAGVLIGIVLANMVPEMREPIWNRALEYANNRVIGGVHYRSDVEAGRVAATVIAQVVSSHPDFQIEFKNAKSELRSALGI